MARQSFAIGEIEATARTMREAKTQVNAAVTVACSGSYNPWIFTDAGRTLLVWRTAMYGWTYTILRSTAETDGRYVNMCSTLPYGNDHAKVRSSAAYHFAQDAYAKYEDIHPTILDVMDADTRSELQFWYAWQARHAKAKASGLSDEECRAIADRG